MYLATAVPMTRGVNTVGEMGGVTGLRGRAQPGRGDPQAERLSPPRRLAHPRGEAWWH